MVSFGGIIKAIVVGVLIGFVVLYAQVFRTNIEADFSELNKPTDTPAIQLMEFRSNQAKEWEQ